MVNTCSQNFVCYITVQCHSNLYRINGREITRPQLYFVLWYGYGFGGVEIFATQGFELQEFEYLHLTVKFSAQHNKLDDSYVSEDDIVQL